MENTFQINGLIVFSYIYPQSYPHKLWKSVEAIFSEMLRSLNEHSVRACVVHADSWMFGC